MPKKLKTKDDVLDAIEQAALIAILDTVENWCWHDALLDELDDIMTDQIKTIVKAEIVPRLAKLTKDEKLMDKLAKDLLKAKVFGGLS